MARFRSCSYRHFSVATVRPSWGPGLQASQRFETNFNLGCSTHKLFQPEPGRAVLQLRTFTSQSIAQLMKRHDIQVNQLSQLHQHDAAGFEARSLALQHHLRRIRIASAALVVTFVGVFLANTYVEHGGVPSLPGFETHNYEVTDQFHSRQHYGTTPKASDLEALFHTRMLSYQVQDWPPQNWSFRASFPYVAYSFAHPNVLNLAVSCFVTHRFTRGLMWRYGVLKTLFIFTGSGFMASQLHCLVDNAYASGSHPQLFKYIKSSPTDVNPVQSLTGLNMGAGYAICSMFTISLLDQARATRGYGFLRAGPGIFATLIVGLNAWAYYENMYTPYSGGSLAGIVSGLILHLGWLRWTKFPRALRNLG